VPTRRVIPSPEQPHCGDLLGYSFSKNRISCREMKKGKIVDGEARDRLIIWIRRRMDEFGITTEALAASLAHDAAHPPLYRDARGNEWNGIGAMPDWIRAAKNAGVNPDFFRIEVKPATPTLTNLSSSTTKNDPRQFDLFS
jgi:DNA-binding protein H-NS